MSSTVTLRGPTEAGRPEQPRRGTGIVPAVTAIPFVVAIAMLAWIWLSLTWHYHIPAVTVEEGVVEKARVSPPDTTFAQLARLHATEPPWSSDSEALRLAEEMLTGKPVRIGAQQVSLSMALAPVNDNVPLGSMLSLAAMEPAQLMVRAYQLTGDEKYLAQAKDMVLAFDSWDRHAWMPVGLAWNDHAIAARVQVLADFWGAYRHSEIYNARESRRVLEFVARCGQRLNDDRYFTVATNHGVMQNISLLEIALAFPNLPGAATYRDEAVRRLNTQMGFYVSDEGVVLEHSAFYQQFGLRLLTVAGRMMQMLEVPLPESWHTKFRLALEFYRQLQRPDGSLPQFGDTYSGPESFGVDDSGAPSTQNKPAQPVGSLSLYPVSGYSISWNGADRATPIAQTVVAWSNFPSGSHKHDDDLSLLVWAGGQSWWTNVGEWPYGDPGRAAGESWNASNAPHLSGERNSQTPGRLNGAGSSQSLRFVDVEREAPGSVVLRRQIVEVQPARWIVLDSTSGVSAKQVVTLWNTAANVSVRDEGDDCYRLISAVVPSTLETCIVAGAPLKAEWARGSMRPFAGWQVVDHTPTPANALLVEQSTGSWFVNSFQLLNDTTARQAKPAAVQWHGPERWTVELANGDKFVREGASIRWTSPREAGASLTLSAPSRDIANRVEAIRASYFSAVKRYPKFEDSFAARRKLTMLLLGGLFATLTLLAMVRRIWSQVYAHLAVLAAILWIAGALTLVARFKTIF